jgi:hypothetical protein
MSISNKIIMGSLWLTHFLNPPLKNTDEIYAHAKAHNKKQTFRVPINSEKYIMKFRGHLSKV